MFGSLSGWGQLCDSQVFYQQARAGSVFDQWGGVVDVFDWHKATSTAHTLRFEEVYFLSISLLGFLSLTASTFW
jgi:hypothetical protein